MGVWGRANLTVVSLSESHVVHFIRNSNGVRSGFSRVARQDTTLFPSLHLQGIQSDAKHKVAGWIALILLCVFLVSVRPRKTILLIGNIFHKLADVRRELESSWCPIKACTLTRNAGQNSVRKADVIAMLSMKNKGLRKFLPKPAHQVWHFILLLICMFVVPVETNIDRNDMSKQHHRLAQWESRMQLAEGRATIYRRKTAC